jgi:hypothetical protein
LGDQDALPALAQIAYQEDGEIDDPADERHEYDEADPARGRALIGLGEQDVNSRTCHASELDEGEEERPDIRESGFHRAPEKGRGCALKRSET